jgi:hypothetical protein
MPCVGFEPTIPASEREKIVHALDRSGTVTGSKYAYTYNMYNDEHVDNNAIGLIVFNNSPIDMFIVMFTICVSLV